MKIHVTQRDFDEGIQSLCRQCPVGRAANRVAVRRGWDYASVGKTTIRFVVGKGGNTKFYDRQFSARTRRFIRNFDWGRLDGLAFKPFYFIVQDIPDLTAGNPG